MNPKGSKRDGGQSFCHYCRRQLQLKPGRGFYFEVVLTPGDGYPTRVHMGCMEKALLEGYKKP